MKKIEKLPYIHNEKKGLFYPPSMLAITRKLEEIIDTVNDLVEKINNTK